MATRPEIEEEKLRQETFQTIAISVAVVVIVGFVAGFLGFWIHSYFKANPAPSPITADGHRVLMESCKKVQGTYHTDGVESRCKWGCD